MLNELHCSTGTLKHHQIETRITNLALIYAFYEFKCSCIHKKDKRENAG